MMKKTRFLVMGIIAGLAMASTAMAANYYQSSESSIVSVQYCQQVGKDIRITYNNQTYTLASTCRDAGYGLRDYTFTCSGTQKYVVTWKSCVNSTPTPTPVPTPTVNTKPVITLNGGTKTMYVGDNYISPSVSAFDTEDGNITYKIKVTGVVNSQVAGTYTQTFTVVDSKNLAADPKTHTVIVSPKSVTPAPNTKPVILVSGGTTSLVAGGTYTPPTVTATDAEDGNITYKIQSTGSVNAQVAGTYTLTFKVSDSKGLAADPKSFTVTVSAKPAEQNPGSKTCTTHSQCNDGVAYTIDWCHIDGANSHCHNDVVSCTTNTQCQTNGATGYTCGKPFGASGPNFCTK